MQKGKKPYNLLLFTNGTEILIKLWDWPERATFLKQEDLDCVSMV